MNIPASVAFVDVETTGLSPTADRIAEVGVVAVDNGRVERWSTLIRSSPHAVHIVPADDGTAVSFATIAEKLEHLLQGRLVIAHNARFDTAFLRAEFARVHKDFAPHAICSVMLSRKLYPQLARHDLDSLASHHGLRIATRHRALPDADALWQLWQIMLREQATEAFGAAIAQLLAGPLLPEHLDPALIDKLPDCPGVYELQGEGNLPLFVGAARNLKRRVIAYFRNGKLSGRALEYSHRITNITWRPTAGVIGARLYACGRAQARSDTPARSELSSPFTWELRPDQVPCVLTVPLLENGVPRTPECFCVFPSARKSRNALVRLASRHRLCSLLLGIAGSQDCGACECVEPELALRRQPCTSTIRRPRHLLRLFQVLRPMRLPPWPYAGAIGIRERRDVHVVHQWQFLGSARTTEEIHDVMMLRSVEFSWPTYRLLQRILASLPRHRIVDLRRHFEPSLINTLEHCAAAVPLELSAE